MSEPAKGGELFIVDNSEADWKVLRYLKEWTEIAKSFDIATGHFEIGGLLALDGDWQKLEKIRILMGDEVSIRTQKAFQEFLKRVGKALDESIEKEKEKNEFLAGAPAIAEALAHRKIECRIYDKAKFHAKAYITHAKMEVVGSAALVGSSNFSYPGLTENVELNIQIRREVSQLQEWFEHYWKDAKEVTPELLKVVERHIREYSPFEVYAKALYEFFRGHEMTASEWELAGPKNGGSHLYPRLDQYQKEGYQSLLKIARQFRGALLCDGVGLGKTFIGMMLIERLVMHERKRVALFVPKAARKSVWESALRQYLPHIGGDFTNLVIFNHTDLTRASDFPGRMARMKEMADVVIIDEAHHFRNPGVKGQGEGKPSRYWQLHDILEDKTVFLLTATPINNRLIDFTHSYDGAATDLEEMHLEFQALLSSHPALAKALPALPGRVFSGKKHLTPGTKAVFFCYALPAPEGESRESAGESSKVWTEEAGLARWYLYDVANEKIAEQPEDIIGIIRCAADTPRVTEVPPKDLSEIRKKIEKHITNTYFKSVQAPVGVKSILKCWMELS